MNRLFDDWASHGENWGDTEVYAQWESKQLNRQKESCRWLTRKELRARLVNMRYRGGEGVHKTDQIEMSQHYRLAGDPDPLWVYRGAGGQALWSQGLGQAFTKVQG